MLADILQQALLDHEGCRACLRVPQLTQGVAQGMRVACHGAVPQVGGDAQPLLLQAGVPDPVLLPCTKRQQMQCG